MSYELTYLYDNSHQRCKSTLADASYTVEKWYNGAYEKMVDNATNTTYDIHYIPGGAGVCAMIVVENGTEQIYPVYTDHLGSIVALTDLNGDMVAQQAFDPWGRRRDPAEWTYDISSIAPPLPWLYRGYTGHEHIDPFVLINMNGRMYDPLNGRMLSADNYIASMMDTQAQNRYAYALNNPLKYTDPSGELPFLVPVIIGALAGAYVGGAIQQGGGGLENANWNMGTWDNTAWQGVMTGALVGAGVGLAVSVIAPVFHATITGVTVAGQSSYGATTAAWNIISNALLTANVNMASAALQGEDWEFAARSGLIGLIAGGIGGAVGSAFREPQGAMSLKGIRWQNSVTSMINGGADRYGRSVDAGLSESEVVDNTIMGAFEGFLMADVLNDNRLGKIHVNDLDKTSHLSVRFSTSLLAQAGTSVPGAGFWIWRTYASVSAGYHFFTNGALQASFAAQLTKSVAAGAMTDWGLGAVLSVRHHLVDSYYLQMSPLPPSYGPFWPAAY